MSVPRPSPTIARAAARVLEPLVADAEKDLRKLASGRAREKRVHTLRGTLRKLEIVIGVLGCGFDPHAADRLRRMIRQTRKTAGSVRDMDVAIGVVRDLCAADEATEEAGEQVVEILLVRRAKAARRLAALVDAEPRTVGSLLDAMLAAPAGRRAKLAARSAFTLALARETSAMRDAVAAGLSTPELLHDLRLNLKEARTVLEALPRVYAAAGDPLASRAKSLSDTLGEINDLASLVELLTVILPRAPKKRHASIEAVLVLARAAHERGHHRGVARATREVPALVRDIRAVIFNTTPPFATTTTK